MIIDQTLKCGVAAHREGKLLEAERLYKQVLNSQVNNPEANHNLGVLAVSVGKVEAALPYFKVALENNPKQTQFWLSYITALIKLERIDDAKTLLKRGKEFGLHGDKIDQLEVQLFPKASSNIKPDNPSKRQLDELIVLYNKRELYQAINLGNSLADQFPSSSVIKNILGAIHALNNDIDSALSNYDQAIELKPDYFEAYSNRGSLLRKLKNYDNAIKNYNLAIKINPNFADAYFNLGNTLKELGRYTEAINCLNKAIDRRKNYLEAHHNLANIFLEVKRPKEAIPHLKTLIKNSTNDIFAYRSVATALQELSDNSTAILYHKKVLVLKPGNTTYYNDIGISLSRSENHLAASIAYKKALIIDGKSIITLNNLGLSLSYLGNLKEAINYFEKVFQLDPFFSLTYDSLGITFGMMGENEKANYAFKKAILLKPNEMITYNSFATLLLRSSDNTAIQLLSRGLVINPMSFDLNYNLGNALNELGQSKKGINLLEKAVKIEPSNKPANYYLGSAYKNQRLFEKAIQCFEFSDIEFSKARELECLYHLDRKGEFFKKLEQLKHSQYLYATMGSLVSHASIRYQLEENNPFCNRAVDYLFSLDLNQNEHFNTILKDQIFDFIIENANDGKRQGLLKNGWQSKGNFFETKNPIVKPLEKLIFSMISQYKRRFRDSEEGFLRHWPREYSLYGWFLSIKSGGSLASHMHENGWLSGSIYFNIPKRKSRNEGNLVISQDSNSLPDVKGEFQEEMIILKTGLGCLFPSSLFHYTIPFEADEDRIVFAFDVVPSNYKIS